MKTTNRASRKAGKKPTSAQSAIVPKIAPGQPVEISPENPAFAGLSPELIEEARVSTSINLGPFLETRANTYKGQIEFMRQLAGILCVPGIPISPPRSAMPCGKDCAAQNPRRV